LYKLHLILKYLRRRRIAWVALLAVMLCTMMVIVVISIMGGWLRMYEKSARGMSGDIVIRSAGLSGFAYYDDIVEQLKTLPYVEAAVPQIHVPGLAAIYVVNWDGSQHAAKTEPVQVFGIQADKTGLVNKWPESLFLQHSAYVDEGKTPPERKSFDANRQHVMVVLESVPEPISDAPYAVLLRAMPWVQTLLPWVQTDSQFIPGPVWDRLYFDDRFANIKMGLLRADGSATVTLSTEDRNAIDRLAPFDKNWTKTVTALASITNRQGLIAGSRLIDVHRNETGKIVGRDPFKYNNVWVKLTVLGIGTDQQVRLEQKGEPEFWVVDDSRTGMWQYDNNSVYVDFSKIQTELSMNAKVSSPPKGTFREWLGAKVIDPARTTEIHVKLRPGADLEAARNGVNEVVQRVLRPHHAYRYSDSRPRVETWRQASRTYLEAIEKEKVLVVLLFGIISLVAVLLILCIFYMIVAEKTKDIGIIKSVGATKAGVAGIFIGYGLAIGIVGAGLGLLSAYCVVHNINEIHDFMAYRLGLVVWNPEVYAFDTIPNEMNPGETTLILSVAVLASVLGSVFPAVVAARKQPVDSLRWE
jgi:lipoprotein-releasing system permease protein